ncbi:MAG: hypothetical protein RLZZ417_833 [Bacteroidota bacterium]|jgi:LacI family transcriptional regulator
MENVNIKKLAKELNLSVSTVSKALHDSYEIKAETKEKVLALAKQLNYQPNPFASSLRRNSSKTIAVVIPEIAHNFFSLVINGIESVAEDLKYHVLIYITHEIPEKEEQIIKHLLNGRVDGVLISSSGSTNNNAHYHELIQKGIPFVFFDRAIFDIDAPRVITDDYQAGFQATEHLINRECKNFVFLSLSNQMSAINHRKDGFEAALRHHHVNQSNIHILEAGTDETLSFQLIRNFLKPLPELLGIFSSVEKLAVQTYHICKEIDIQIPKQLKIISFSNLPTAALLNPALSTLTQPAFSIGKEAAKLLFQRIKNKGKIQNMTSLPQLVLNSTLFIRESTQI